MKKRRDVDLLNILADFQKNILQSKPTIKKMWDEVRMMNFKIRPVQGDVSLLNLREDKLIETLWNLGKLDEFYQKHSRHMTHKQRNIFFNFFDELYHKLQNQLNKLDLRTSIRAETQSTIEMEIFRENSSKSN